MDNAIKRAIKNAGLTQTELARKMKYSKTMINAMASGRNIPRLDTAARLCRELGIENPMDLYDDDGLPRP